MSYTQDPKDLVLDLKTARVEGGPWVSLRGSDKYGPGTLMVSQICGYAYMCYDSGNITEPFPIGDEHYDRLYKALEEL